MNKNILIAPMLLLLMGVTFADAPNTYTSITFLNPSAQLAYNLGILGNVGITSATASQSIPTSNYVASLIVYINPTGYFEYVLSNTSAQSFFTFNPSFYQDKQLDVYTFTPTNTLNFSANSPSNTSVSSLVFSGAILNSQLIDINPLEVKASSGLSYSNFSTFIAQNQQSFYNGSVIFSITTNTGYLNNAINLNTVLFNLGNIAQSIHNFVVGITGQSSNINGILNSPQLFNGNTQTYESIIPINLQMNFLNTQYADNGQIAVYYVYDNQNSLNPSSFNTVLATNPTDFNNFFNHRFAIDILYYILFNQVFPEILALTIMFIIVKEAE